MTGANRALLLNMSALLFGTRERTSTKDGIAALLIEELSGDDTPDLRTACERAASKLIDHLVAWAYNKQIAEIQLPEEGPLYREELLPKEKEQSLLWKLSNLFAERVPPLSKSGQAEVEVMVIASEVVKLVLNEIGHAVLRDPVTYASLIMLSLVYVSAYLWERVAFEPGWDHVDVQELARVALYLVIFTACPYHLAAPSTQL